MENIEDFKRLCEINCKDDNEIKDMVELRRKVKNRVSFAPLFNLLTYLVAFEQRVLDNTKVIGIAASSKSFKDNKLDCIHFVCRKQLFNPGRNVSLKRRNYSNKIPIITGSYGGKRITYGRPSENAQTFRKIWKR